MGYKKEKQYAINRSSIVITMRILMLCVLIIYICHWVIYYFCFYIRNRVLYDSFNLYLFSSMLGILLTLLFLLILLRLDNNLTRKFLR